MTPDPTTEGLAEAGDIQTLSKSEGNEHSTNMNLIKAGTSNLNADKLIALSGYVEGKMKSNPNFPTPNPSLATVTAAREALVVAVEEAKSRAIAATAVRNQLTIELRTLLVNLARYVNNVSAGDVEKAVSSGFEPAKRPEPSTHLEAPTKVEVAMGDYEGSVDLNWKGVKDARMYQVYVGETTADGTIKWTLGVVGSRTRARINGLVRFKNYSFRVTALGRVGEGPASETVSCHAA